MPSLPLTVTCVAFAADTVRIEEPVAVMETGFALTVTAGGGFEVTVTVTAAAVFPPDPLAIAV